MAVPSLDQFKTRYPEFATTADALLLAVIDDAAGMFAANVMGAQHTQAVMAQAADFLARSPFARDMKLVLKDGSTAYSDHVERLRRISAIGIRAL